ncbi:MAG: amidohydrolase [Caulobacteraceae bacterium]|nr:amidohydrolase [Caulobacteraceae bacterium]
MMRTLEDPVLRGGLPLARDRTPQATEDVSLPKDVRLVSADTHWELSQDIFIERFPAHLKDRAPRVTFDGIWRVGYPGQAPTDPLAQEMAERMRAVLSLVIAPGMSDMALRATHLAEEGVEKEIAYPQGVNGFFRHPDLELREWVYRVYNEHLAEVQQQSGGRFYGVGVCSNWWDPAKAEAAIGQIADLGLKTFMIPTMSPGNMADGRPIFYGGEEMAPFWSAAAEAGLPVAFHVGENFALNAPDSFATSVIVNMGCFRKPFCELVFSGVFDRHPDLRVVFAEGGIGWVPAALQDAEATVDSHLGALPYIPKHRPSDYWFNNCYATFQNDVLGLRLIDYIGADRIMWANDYPHNEGAFGYGRRSAQTVLNLLPGDQARLALGETAASLYRLDS